MNRVPLKIATRHLALMMPPRNFIAKCPCGGEVLLRDSGYADCLECKRWYRVAFIPELTPYRKKDAWP